MRKFLCTGIIRMHSKCNWDDTRTITGSYGDYSPCWIYKWWEDAHCTGLSGACCTVRMWYQTRASMHAYLLLFHGFFLSKWFLVSKTFWCFLQAIITEGALHVLIETYCREAGVRNLQKQIEKIYRKVRVKTLFMNACIFYDSTDFVDIWECKSGLHVLFLSDWLLLIDFVFCTVRMYLHRENSSSKAIVRTN